ncbi:hypothetical protein [Arhodomonas sp. SL1]|uniref:hypothetical protein n=1 Tax=Arhodomonas sp. SL1 TaxID=3425691 RepID=UPI003F8805E2
MARPRTDRGRTGCCEQRENAFRGSKERAAVTVLGFGYIGLPTASLLATQRFSVHGVDVDAEVVDTINQGAIHIVEPDPEVLVCSAVRSGQRLAGMEPEPAGVFSLTVARPRSCSRAIS